jgi:hypothetical protein
LKNVNLETKISINLENNLKEKSEKVFKNIFDKNNKFKNFSETIRIAELEEKNNVKLEKI